MSRTSKVALLLPALLLLASDTSAAVGDAACCLQTTSRLDGILNPVEGGDEKFFTSSGGAPSILFVLDTSSSMYAWPKSWPSTGRGCDFASINDLGYKPDVTYPGLWKSLTEENGEWFDRGRVYEIPSRGYGRNFTGSPSGRKWYLNNLGNGDRNADACHLGNDVNQTYRNDCKRCLETKGYYIYSGSERRVTGNFLNFYSPRDSGAVMVLSQIVRDLQQARIGILAFETSSKNSCWYSDKDRGCVCLFQGMGPACSESWPQGEVAIDGHRNTILANLQDKLGWGSCGTPLSGLLYSAGYYLGTKNDPFSGGSNRFAEPSDPDHKTVCTACGLNAVVLLTDGAPNNEDSWVKIPRHVTDNKVMCGSKECHSTTKLDEVAKYLWENDNRKDHDGQQRIATYTIGFSEDVSGSTLLRKVAEVGGGKFYPATSTSELRQALSAIVDDVVKRNTAFASSNIASLQSGNSSQAAIMPRMLPQSGRLWQGQLYRFNLHNEFVLDDDKNEDGDKDDIFVVDTSKAIVVENEQGQFVRKDSNTQATPVWEARAELLKKGHEGRTIYTVIDDKGPNAIPDGALTHHDSMVEFTEDNWRTLLPYLGIQGNGFCPSATDLDRVGTFLTEARMSVQDLLDLLGFTFSNPTQEQLDEACARAFIRFVRGQDVLDEDRDGDRRETRDSVLGDIFHSSPVQVDPPVERFLCEIGLHNQCVRTLYANGTPLATYDETTCDGQDIKRDAYDSYMWKNRKRDKLVLVGTNGGMLHAFHNGDGEETCENGASTIAYADSNATGDEVWAFIPPDLLSRLQDMVTGHTFFVDGDIMVRDIWADDPEGGTLGVKDADEYHTLAIVAEGRGGNHYFALELRFDESGNATKPGFRWMFPQPCSEEASLFGKTLFSLSPRPPPIGPVLLDAHSLGVSTGVMRNGKSTVEQWVTMLSGGWSPGMEKGRGIYMVDAWWGVVNDRPDNLWWKFEHDPDASGERDEPRKYMTYSVVAPVAMVDYGDPTSPTLDGFFDTGVVGDTGGQVWTLRFSDPGLLDPTTKLIANWTGARAFEQDRDAMTGTGRSVKNLWPFHYLASVALQNDTNILRAFLGTGDRYAVLDKDAGMCRFDNPLACAKYGCSDVATTYQIEKGKRNITNLGTTWSNQTLTGTPFETATATAKACGEPGGTAVSARFTATSVNRCSDGGNLKNFGNLRNMEVTCGLDVDGNYFTCERTDSVVERLVDLEFDYSSKLAGLGKNRFYGFHLFGGSRTFDESKNSKSSEDAEDRWTTAKEYDEARLTDRVAGNDSGDLVDVTTTTCKADGSCTGPAATGESKGWMLEYPALSYKTATGASTLASCVVWNSLYPSGTGGCGNPTGSVGRAYQADFITGEPNCAAGFRDENNNTFARFMERDLLAPPPEPATAIQISKTGAIKYSSVLLEPGKEQATEISVSGGGDVLQSVYVLPVSRSMHRCRHEGGQEDCVTTVP